MEAGPPNMEVSTTKVLDSNDAQGVMQRLHGDGIRRTCQLFCQRSGSWPPSFAKFGQLDRVGWAVDLFLPNLGPGRLVMHKNTDTDSLLRLHARKAAAPSYAFVSSPVPFDGSTPGLTNPLVGNISSNKANEALPCSKILQLLLWDLDPTATSASRTWFAGCWPPSGS